jgi:undecaprenyl-diphosphatase
MAQAVAILPGCSRSGWTITTALLLGLGFERAAEFSFLMSVPAILGALAVELAGGGAVISAGELPGMVVGAAAAFVSGWFALKLVIRILGSGTFHRFAWYLIPAGILGVIYFLTSG